MFIQYNRSFIVNFIGLDANNKAHAEYLDKITTDFQQQMIASIDKSIEEREKNERLALTPDSEEFMKHAVLVQEKCEGVRRRDAIIQVCSLRIRYGLG